eukprot:TRINITY_DN7034_c0_g4_i1.p1 TRINITY_DN7034_c0_g4~~TRINITY_DN7034_c0_g4_i1.p1  ORF type:complete len:108 (+),score=11.33 TRINITY_DN7034_c0_g4_i1:108-431(+)
MLSYYAFTLIFTHRICVALFHFCVKNIYRFQNYHTGTLTVPVNCLAFCNQDELLFTGDDKGEIKAWSLRDVIMRGGFVRKTGKVCTPCISFCSPAFDSTYNSSMSFT